MKENISIPKGVDSGVNLRMSKKGNYSLKGEAGDLLITVNIRPHPYFSRQGIDIHTVKYVTMTQAILGSAVRIETLTGKTDIKLRPGTTHEEVLKIEGMGISKLPPN